MLITVQEDFSSQHQGQVKLTLTWSVFFYISIKGFFFHLQPIYKGLGQSYGSES